MYAAIDVAKYVVNYCTEAKCPISNLKLQKMLYYLWIDYYKETKNELFRDDICAWQLGPVVPNVYYEFCQYAGMPISLTFEAPINNSDINVLDRIIHEYLEKPVNALVEKTHQKGKPWDLIYQNGVGIRGVIPFPLIMRLECNSQSC